MKYCAKNKEDNDVILKSKRHKEHLYLSNFRYDWKKLKTLSWKISVNNNKKTKKKMKVNNEIPQW